MRTGLLGWCAAGHKVAVMPDGSLYPHGRRAAPCPHIIALKRNPKEKKA